MICQGFEGVTGNHVQTALDAASIAQTRAQVNPNRKPRAIFLYFAGAAFAKTI
jgi:hypothetical protein